jgi:periplasmic protein TonB
MSGTASERRLLASSGDAAIDRAALAMLNRSQPFPAPPGVGDDRLTFEVNVQFNRSK